MRVALVGITGFGRTHLTTIRGLEGAELVGTCDLRPPPPELATELAGVPHFAEFDALLRQAAPELTVLATPPQTHAELAELALTAGSDVLLEKPPVTSIADLDRLLAAEQNTGHLVEVGFQTMGSAALAQLRELVETGELGAIEGIGSYAAWQRDCAYFGRADWAGRRVLNGVQVVDGVLSNPFAHSIMNACALAGTAATARAAASVELELWRANDIESDDTSCLRARFAGAPPIVVSGTLCADRILDPVVLVHGERATAELAYLTDELTITYRDGRRTEARFGRTSQLANLVAGGRPLCPLADTRGFTSVLEAIANAAAPNPIPQRFWRQDGDVRIVDGAAEAVRRAATELRLFTELDATPWTTSPLPAR
ncbi:Gfo/Idh/MocA family protein [Labedaea rhizosphaerae]|uniref:Putative dehydrogenase n=1 Tax=Labedaea rhizosphaerae TaxID=598644 RepID=A0A4R6S7U1_LABRH|nr:Gfo/Idh/MocA family oxidoreductase [Labedaea rhizosphaerae]TDP94896.1 putative dehydrogenase [Labedaea rhizosphaerae]